MKISKNQIYNLSLLVFAVLVLFTPVGTAVKVWVNRLVAVSPSRTPEEHRENIGSYHWDLRTQDGGIYDFSNARDKVVLINFWATWCPPCIAEMPALHRLYKDYGNKVVFLFVTGEDPETVREFLRRKEWDIPAYFPLTSAPEKIYSSSIPVTWVLNKKGNIVIGKKGVAAWDSDEVRDILDGLIAE